MPKAERGTPKDIGNRIKAKGLQKLKFYCQMCQKQCRDQNGFKCHLTSDSHLRQMKIFSEHAHGMLDNLSKEFEKAFLDTLRQRHGTKRVNANNVYQEVIRDRHHIHMNATKWVTLTDFCQYLGRTGKCVVEETERGWYVQYIERDAAILARQDALQQRLEAEQAAEVAQAQRMEVQRVEAAKALDRAGGTNSSTEATALERDNNNEETTTKLAVALSTVISRSSSKANANRRPPADKSIWNDDEEEEEDDEGGDDEKEKSTKTLPAVSHETVHKNTDRSRKEQNHSKPLHNRGEQDGSISNKRAKHDQGGGLKDYWLHRGIIVRIITKKLAQGKYYKHKAIVKHVVEDDPFTAEVEVIRTTDDNDRGDVLRLDQDDLETVVPKEIGAMVRIVNGPGRGKRARVVSLDKKKYLAALQLEDGTSLERVDYERFSMIADTKGK